MSGPGSGDRSRSAAAGLGGEPCMSDILAIFGVLIVLGLTYPGMLTTWRMLFPSVVLRSCLRLSSSPWKCFAFGGLVALGFATPALFLIALPFGPAKLIGWSILAAPFPIIGWFVFLPLSTLAAAGAAGFALLNWMPRMTDPGLQPVPTPSGTAPAASG